MVIRQNAYLQGFLDNTKDAAQLDPADQQAAADYVFKEFRLHLQKDCSAATISLPAYADLATYTTTLATVNTSPVTYAPYEYIINTAAPADTVVVLPFISSDEYCRLDFSFQRLGSFPLEHHSPSPTSKVIPKRSGKTAADIFYQEDDTPGSASLVFIDDK